MTNKGYGLPLTRPANLAGRIVLWGVVVLAGLPLWLALVAGITAFALFRPLVNLLLSMAFLGAIVVAVYFAVSGQTREAVKAVVVALLSGAGVATVAAVADRLGVEQRPVYPLPPWWWFV